MPVVGKWQTPISARLPAGCVAEGMISYWLSFDPDARMLKYGMGHHMEETTLLSCALPGTLGSLFKTCPKLVSLHGYSGSVQLRSVYEAKLSTTGGRAQVRSQLQKDC